MLMEYVDITNSGTYDFLYLRIDFQNKCKYVTGSERMLMVAWDMLLSISLILFRLFRSPKPGSAQNGLLSPVYLPLLSSLSLLILFFFLFLPPFCFSVSVRIWPVTVSQMLTPGTASIQIKFAIFPTRIFKGKNVSLRNSATVALWMKIHVIVLKSFTPAVLSWAKNRSPSRKLLSSTYHFFLLSITYSSIWSSLLYQRCFGLSDDRFPEPNNARRKLRSIACARQIGPFPHLLSFSTLPIWDPDSIPLSWIYI